MTSAKKVPIGTWTASIQENEQGPSCKFFRLGIDISRMHEPTNYVKRFAFAHVLAIFGYKGERLGGYE